METNDFLGSFAQENVSFTTQYARTTKVGDNFWKVMIFVENDRFVNINDGDWQDVTEVLGVKARAVTSENYLNAMIVPTVGVNILQSWLSDLFINGFSGECILVACGNSYGESGVTDYITGMTDAYNALKAYAYHKTVCANPTIGDEQTEMTSIGTSIATALASLCKADKNILSAAPYYPFTTTTPEEPSSDALYSALLAANADAFMSAYQDTSRNTALYSLGVALASLNGSGTCIGNSLDMIASTNIQGSGANGSNLSKAIRDALADVNIQTFKPVGDNSGSYAAIGAKTIFGDVVQASWIVAYITYMVKVAVAKMITTPNFLKNAANYMNIITVMGSYVQMFGDKGSGRLSGIVVTAPSFGDIPDSKVDEIVIPNAWTATYQDQLRNVRITGTLYIGV